MRIFNRVISLFLVLVLVMSFPICNSAAALRYTDLEEIVATINRYSFSSDNEYTIVDSIPMRSFVDNLEQYTLYILAPYGYAILYNETNGFMEGCYKQNTFVEQLESQTTYYYGGPGNYYVYDGELYHSLITGDILELAEIQFIANSEENVHANEAAQFDAATVSPYGFIDNDREVVVEESYFSTLVEHGYNENGTCTVLAAAILLGYYDEFVDDNYVATRFRDGKGTHESFHQHLNDYVYTGAQEGIYIREALTGINSYLADTGINERMYSIYSSQGRAVNKVISMLESERPVIASMGTAYGATWDHTVVVYGAVYNTTTGAMPSAVFQVHMGWGQGHTSEVVNANWFYECGYIA